MLVVLKTISEPHCLQDIILRSDHAFRDQPWHIFVSPQTHLSVLLWNQVCLPRDTYCSNPTTTKTWKRHFRRTLGLSMVVKSEALVIGLCRRNKKEEVEGDDERRIGKKISFSIM